MLRVFALLALLPTTAAAEWSPHPLMFTYEAAFAQCTADPTAPDLAPNCAASLESAYALKRAVAWAAYRCADQDLATCPLPFEDEGLPAIAMRIATSTDCDATDVLDLPQGVAIPPQHCITVASDIMIDEGIVPLITDMTCGVERTECTELALINARLWAGAALAATAEDSANLTVMRQEAAKSDCTAQPTTRRVSELAALECEADRNARLWADLVTGDS